MTRSRAHWEGEGRHRPNLARFGAPSHPNARLAQTRLPWAVATPRLDAPREGLHDLYDVLAANEETDRDDLCLGDLTRGVDYLEAAAWMLRLWGFELGEIAAFTTLDRETARRAIVRTEDYVSGTGGASSATHPTRGSVLVGDPGEEAAAFAQALGDLVAECDLVSAARGAQRSPDQVIAFVREFGSWLGKARHAVCPRAPLPPEMPNTIRRAWDHAASADVTDEHLRRFFQRRNRTPLTAGERVLVAWQLARAGRLGEIDRAHPFGSALVEDIGLLGLHLAVTRDAYATLDAAAATRPVGRERLTEALNALSWLHEAEVRRALDALDALCTAEARDVADAGRNLLRRLRHLAREPRPCGAAELSEAQVRRHLPSVGLPLLGELNITRPTRLRQRLLSTARRADVDQLLPAAQIAEARGELAEFLDALAA